MSATSSSNCLRSFFNSSTDKFALAQSIDKLISSGSMLINEVREELGLEAVPWGDKPLITKNYQLGEDIEKGGEKEDESDSD